MVKNLKTRFQDNKLKGEIVIPADKSISHRSLIIGSLTKGKIKINNYSSSLDCLSTMNIIKNLGAEIEFLNEKEIVLNAKNCYKKPLVELDCGNSGTSMRLLSGILAAQDFESVLKGDVSLSKRTMKRVITPLTLMGAKIKSNDDKAPLSFYPSKLNGIDYESKISSAQVKSCVILAGLNAEGLTTFKEPTLSRNHTELMLQHFGANLSQKEDRILIEKSELEPKDIEIVGDISSAAFFMVAALCVKNSDILIKNVGINPTRAGILDVLKEMGADFEILNKREISKEEVGDIRIKYTENLRPITIKGDIIPRLIDEIPIIAVLLTQANGISQVKDAEDLRNKESDRIKLVTSELTKLGAKIQETNDGFIIEGKSELKGGKTLSISHDHRLAMSLFVASLLTKENNIIEEFEWVNTSFPEFLSLMSEIGVDL